MNITHVSFGFNTGGAELMMSDIMGIQAEEGHNVTLLLINDRYEEALLQKIPSDVRVVKVGRPSGSKNPLWYLKYNILLRRTRPDAVHFHQAKASSLTIPSRGTGYVETVHCLGAPVRKRGFIDRYVAISEAVSSDLEKRMHLHTAIIQNGINSRAITPRCSAPRKEEDPFRIVCVSRLDHGNKGQDIAIEALSKLKESAGMPEIHLDFIGEGASLKMLGDMVAEKHLDREIRFLGNRPRDYIYSHLADYDLFIQPSRFEGFGLTVAEAMVARLPVLISDIEGPMDIIGQGKYGTSFRNGDAGDCARKIASAIGNHRELLALAAGDAYTRVTEKYDIRRTAREYIALYREVAAGKSHNRRP